MPILEYQCKECERQFEAIVLGSQQPMCPSCHGTKLERGLSVFAVGGKSDSFAASNRSAPVVPVVTRVVQGLVAWISFWA
jgi:putative FmdB family regulatory protein